MKVFTGFLCAVLAGALFFFSCKTLPPAAPESADAGSGTAQTPPEEPAGEEEGPPAPGPELAESDTPPDPPEEEELVLILPDPELPPPAPEPVLPELAETGAPAADTPGREPEAGLPAPVPEAASAAPETPALPRAAPAREPAARAQAQAAPAPQAVPAPQTAPPTVNTTPPGPPSFLRPAEPAAAAVPAREAAPVPVNPPGAAPAPQDDITRSRTIRAGPGQTVEIPFRSSGWVFLGEAGSKPGIRYLDRRNDAEGMTFSFLAGQEGDFDLVFYRQDFIRNYIQNDRVRVIVEGPEAAGTVSAARWPQPAAAGTAGAAAPEAPDTAAIPAASAAAGSTGGTTGGTGNPGEASPPPVPVAAAAVPAQPAAPAPPGQGSPPEDFVRLAGEQFLAGNVPASLETLDRFREFYPLGSDEAWWLYGQALEAAGPSRDIKRALDYYRRLVREYPQSPRLAAARRRIAYLERFYFNIP